MLLYGNAVLISGGGELALHPTPDEKGTTVNTKENMVLPVCLPTQKNFNCASRRRVIR